MLNLESEEKLEIARKIALSLAQKALDSQRCEVSDVFRLSLINRLIYEALMPIVNDIHEDMKGDSCMSEETHIKIAKLMRKWRTFYPDSEYGSHLEAWLYYGNTIEGKIISRVSIEHYAPSEVGLLIETRLNYLVVTTPAISLTTRISPMAADSLVRLDFTINSLFPEISVTFNQKGPKLLSFFKDDFPITIDLEYELAQGIIHLPALKPEKIPPDTYSYYIIGDKVDIAPFIFEICQIVTNPAIIRSVTSLIS